MNLYIVRHGESTWNRENKIQGNSNPPLSALGRLQARLLARRFRRVKVDTIYSSPFLRATQTAEVIAAVLKKTVIKKGGLKEVSLGDWEGMTPDEIDAAYANRYQRWLRLGPTKVRIPGAESIPQFRKRVTRVFRTIIRENPRKDIVVVTHGGVIAALLSHLLKADFDRLILNLHLPNTGVTLVSFSKKKGCLIHIADTFHLSLARLKGIWPAEKIE